MLIEKKLENTIKQKETHTHTHTNPIHLYDMR